MDASLSDTQPPDFPKVLITLVFAHRCLQSHQAGGAVKFQTKQDTASLAQQGADRGFTNQQDSTEANLFEARISEYLRNSLLIGGDVK